MVIVTDCMYRSAIAAILALSDISEEIIAVTVDTASNPPALSSKYIKERHVLSSKPEEYKKQLIELCKGYVRPTLFPIGVFTLNIISENKEEFKAVADFAVADKKVLDRLNDKKEAKLLARSVGIRVPEKSESFPLVVKPFCGEKFALKASERYKIVRSKEELDAAVEHFKKYDPSPIVEEYITGSGVGVSIVIGNDGVERTAFCHKRIYEYPASGGPSSLLETFYDGEIVAKAVEMLKASGFVGLAMLEFKLNGGEYTFLEVNPRIWGSFGATYKAGSDFVRAYLSASRDTGYSFAPDYKIKKVKFMPNILASSLSYFKAGRAKSSFGALFSAFNPFVPNAIFSFRDPLPSIKDIFRKRG